MIDFNKLNTQVDLQNIDLNQVLGVLGEHRDTMIKVVLVIGTLFMLMSMFKDYRAKDTNLRAQISAAQQKLTVIKNRDAAVADLTDFKSSLPKKIDELKLIVLISDYAKSNHTMISSLLPAQSQDMGLYDIINIDFNAESDNYKDMVMFLRAIERSKYPLRINRWGGRSSGADEGVSFSMGISAVIIHT